MTVQVPVRLTEKDLAALDSVVASGRFASRSEVLRAGLERVLNDEREREIDAAYRRGYATGSQEDNGSQENSLGLLGLAGLEAFDRGEGGDPL